MFLPLNGIGISVVVCAGRLEPLTRKEVLRTSNPIAMPDGGVIVTLNWFALAPPPIRLALKSSMLAIINLLPR